MRRTYSTWLLGAYTALIFAPNLALIAKDPSVIPIVRGLLVTGLLFGGVFWLFRARIWLACLIFLPFSLFAPAETYYILRYGHPSDANILATVFESNLREASGYLGSAQVYLVFSVCCAALLAMLTTVAAYRARLAWRHRSAHWIAAIALGVPTLTLLLSQLPATAATGSRVERARSALQRLEIETYATFPFGVIGRFVEYREEWAAMRTAAQALRNVRFDARRASASQQREVFVLVIGEASRRDHWALFGYARQTNPALSTTSNVVALDDVISPWGASRWAVPVIVTRKPAEDWNVYYHEPSVTRVFQEAGFATYWLSTQHAVGMYDSPISVTAFDAMHVQFFNPASLSDDSVHDDALLAPLSAAIAASSDNLFVVLHTLGSHQDYRSRYPAAFEHFRPATPGEGASSEQAVANAYDNSILFTDHFLKSVIDILAGSSARTAMFYVADHGEMLPNASCPVAGHAFPGYPVYPVPALFWYSDGYAAQFPDKVEAIKAHRQQPLSTTNVFESLVDMADIRFPGHDESASVFSAHWQPRPRVVHADTTVDFDQKALLPGCQVVVRQKAAPAPPRS